MKKAKILVAEDEKDIRDLIHFNLFKENFEVFTASDGLEALQLAQQHTPDIAILDIMMPGLDGEAVCEKIKATKQTENTFVIMLTAKSSDEDIVRLLSKGADDYVIKPFSPKVLIARVEALLRRKQIVQNVSTDKISVHDINIDLEKRKVDVNSRPLDLTYTEFELLYNLILVPGKVCTRSHLVDVTRGENNAITDRSVDVHIVSLRKKLKEKGKLIETVRGVGYTFKE